MQNKQKSEKTQSMKNRIMAVCLIITTLVSGLFAFLTDTEKVDNVFTVGDVKIKLLEPNWDEDAGKDLWAGKVLTKDPQIKNEGSNSAYVYMMVRVPKKDVTVYDKDSGTKAETDLQLFDYTINAPVAEVPASGDTAAVPAQPGWILKDSELTGDDYNFYLYYYDTALASGDTTGTLFDTVTFANVTEDQFDDKKGDNAKNDLDIYIEAYAIQSQFGDNSDASKLDADAAWDYYATQNGWDFIDTSVEDEDDGTQEGASIPVLTNPGVLFGGYYDENDVFVFEPAIINWEDLQEEENYTKYKYYNDAISDTQLDCSSHFRIFRSNVIEIYIPDTVTTITGDYALNLIPNVKYNGSAEIIDDWYWGATCLNGYVEGGVVYEDSSKSHVVGSYPWCIANVCGKVSSIVLPNTVTVIDREAFAYDGSYYILNLYIPDSVDSTSIGYAAFGGVINIIYSGVSDVSPYGHYQDNSVWWADCANLYFDEYLAYTDDSKTTLLKMHKYCHDDISEIIIPDGVTSVGQSAFYCEDLTSITIPNSVTSIGASAFEYCHELSSVTYNDNVYTSKSALISALTDNGVTISDAAFNDTALSD